MQRIAGFHIVAIVHHHRQVVGIVVIDPLSGHMGSHRLFRICFAPCQCNSLTRCRVVVVIRFGKLRRATVSGGFEAGGRTNPYCDMIVSIKFLPEELQFCREYLQSCFCPDVVCQGGGKVDEGEARSTQNTKRRG